MTAIKEIEIERGQIWQSKGTSGMQVLVHRKVGGGRWKVKKLTNKTGVYNGTHTLTIYTLAKGFERLL